MYVLGLALHGSSPSKPVPHHMRTLSDPFPPPTHTLMHMYTRLPITHRLGGKTKLSCCTAVWLRNGEESCAQHSRAR